MNKTLISLAVAAGLGLGGTAQAVTLTFTTNVESGNAAFPAINPANTASFGSLAGAADPDFRVMNNGSVSGGGEKQIMPGVTWTFDDGTGNLTAVANTDMTPGCTYYCTTNGVLNPNPPPPNLVPGTTSAAPGGDTGLTLSAPFLGKPFGFLAPTVGSAAGNAYGVGVISGDTDGNGTFTINFPTLEAQWSGGIFAIGHTSNGKTAPADTTGVLFNCSATSGNFECTAAAIIDSADDTLGFAGQEVQFDVTGTIPAVVPVPAPAAVWLFGSGLIGIVGVARRKKAV
jgi:hypothetical protein